MSGFWVPGSPGFDFTDLGVYAGVVVSVAAAVGVLWRIALRRPIARLQNYLDWNEQFRADWEGTPLDEDRPWLPHSPSVLERLNALDGEFHDDGNGSLKSSVKRIESMLLSMAERSERVESRQIDIMNRIDGLDRRLAAVEGRRNPAA